MKKPTEIIILFESEKNRGGKKKLKNNQKSHNIKKDREFYFNNPSSEKLNIVVQQGLTNTESIPVPANGCSKHYKINGKVNGSYNYSVDDNDEDQGGNTGHASGSIHVEPDGGEPTVQ